MIKRFTLIVLLGVIAHSVYAQKQVKISGFVFDKQSKETLIGATIYNAQTKKGTTTNVYGFFSFSVDKAVETSLDVSFVGYNKQTINLNQLSDTSINIYLESSTTLDEIVITDKAFQRKFLEENIPGKVEINTKVVAKLPTLTGESDLLKSLQLYSGVKSGIEGTTGIYVRGGNVDQNLYLIDGIEVYNPNHLFGFISAFNTDAIKNINFYKGSFPAEYGGRASSIIDIRNKDGNNEKIKGEVSIGLISAKINLEGPIIKDKTTFSFSLRRTYLDLILKPIIYHQNRKNDEDMDFGYHFSDLNFKIKHRFSPKNSLTASLYMGEDTYFFEYESKGSYIDDNKANVKWGNIIATIDYAHQINHSLFSNLSFSFNRYNSNIGNDYHSKINRKDSVTNYQAYYNFNSGVKDFTLKNNYNYYPNANNSISFGAIFTLHFYSPEVTSEWSKENNVLTTPYEVNNKENAFEGTLYCEDVITLNEKFSLRPGVHINYYNVSGTSYQSFEPRFSMRYLLFDKMSFKAGYAMMHQNIHLLTNGLFSLPTDLWVPVTKTIKPIISNQVTAGLFYQIPSLFDISVEAYYKWLDNVIDYKDGESSFNNSVDWEKRVSQGKGRAYGVEFSLQREKGRFTGWMAYTLSWSKRKYDDKTINNGKEFYDRFDVRHYFNLVVNANIGKHWYLSAAFVINSGTRTNVPIANYYNPFDASGWDLISVYGEKNNLKMPNYHRLDLGISHTKPTKHGQSIWSFNIYNAYNHKNAFFVFMSDKPNTLTAYSIMPIIPTISYTYRLK